MQPTETSALALVAALAALPVAATIGREPPPVLGRPNGKLDRKGDVTDACSSAAILGTLVDTHSAARIALDDLEPTQARFDALLRDPVLGSEHGIDAAILPLVRSIAAHHPLARIEVVSGFRSPKLNEELRKKGHHVASHSQHTLGHAMDLRIVPEGQTVAIDPRTLASEVRELGWKGGVGIYLGTDDRFVHADTGPLRTWYGQ